MPAPEPRQPRNGTEEDEREEGEGVPLPLSVPHGLPVPLDTTNEADDTVAVTTSLGGLNEPPTSPSTTTLPVVSLHLTPSPSTPLPFHFDPIDRDLFENVVLKIGRQVNKGGVNARDSLHGGRDCVWFKSKVVSRNHAEVWVRDGQVRTSRGGLIANTGAI
jgi:hypothetical protein